MSALNSNVSNACHAQIKSSCGHASWQAQANIKSKLDTVKKACGSDQVFTSSFAAFSYSSKTQNTTGQSSSVAAFAFQGPPQFAAQQAGALQGGFNPSNFGYQGQGTGQFGNNPFGALSPIGLGSAVNQALNQGVGQAGGNSLMSGLSQMMGDIYKGIQQFNAGKSQSTSSAFSAGTRASGGQMGVFGSFGAAQNAVGNLSGFMQGFLAQAGFMADGIRSNSATGTAAASVTAKGKDASYVNTKGSAFLDTLKNNHKNAKDLNVSGRHDVKTINKAIDMLKSVAPTISAAAAGSKPGRGQLQLSAEQAQTIRNAPDLKSAKDLVRLAMEKQTGQKFGPINMADKHGIRKNANRQALNKLLGTGVRSGREKNSGSSLVMDSMIENIAKSVRQSSYGSTQVAAAFAAKTVGQDACGAFGYQAAGSLYAEVQNNPGPLNVDLNGFRASANKVGELYSPLIFDLEGLGLKVQNSGLIEVDLDGDGKLEMISDLEAHQGLLVFDSKLGKPGDEDFAAGADMFGNGTDMRGYGIRGPSNDGSFTNGFEALRALAEHFELAHGDKQTLTADDLAILEEECGLRMRVGGVVNGDERRFADIGITEIRLGNAGKIQDIKAAPEDRYGNKLMHQEGANFVVNSQTRDYVDIWFNIQARKVEEKPKASRRVGGRRIGR